MEKVYYCGYESMPKWQRRIFSIKFNASCKVHDLDYKYDTVYTKEEADIRFLKHMLRQADGSLFWEFMALMFYLAVHRKGQKAYKT